ncbi:MAG: hypothetical protein ABSD43_09730, partial [Terracidiphilus sp.]
MKNRTMLMVVALVAVGMGLPTSAFATLTTFTSFSGNIGLSVDAGGSYQTTLPNGLTADIPAGS